MADGRGRWRLAYRIEAKRRVIICRYFKKWRRSDYARSFNKYLTGRNDWYLAS